MNRTDRLYALVEELTTADVAPKSAARLAAKFEVTTRTVKRDIAALQQAGVPIYSVPGPGGGYRLLTTSGLLKPVTFTPAEAVAIATALGTQPDLPFAAHGAAALNKIVRAMTPAASRAATELAERVWTTARPHRRAVARTLDIAIDERRVLKLSYLDRHGNESTRLVDPLQFANRHGRWYLLAYCREKAGGRWFRLDRITGAVLTRRRAHDHDVRRVIGRPPPEAHAIALT